MEEISLFYNLLIIFLLLLGSAFFCFSEGSLFSLSRHQKDRIRKESRSTGRIIDRLLKSPYKLIITILFADEVVNVAYSSLIGLTVHRFVEGSEKTVTLISLAIASPTLLLLGEIGPKTIAVKFPKVFAKLLSRPLYIFHVAITPIRWVLMVLSIGFTKMFGVKLEYEQQTGFTNEELKILVNVSGEEGILKPVERKLVGKFFKLDKVPVHKILTPNADCFFLQENVSIDEAIYEIRKRGHSRIPVYSSDRDHIVGILYSKDLLTVDEEDTKQTKSISEYLRTPYFIPRTKRAFDLLREFQQQRNHMAIVVDEYGRVEGLVTMEDILEELFGEIEDETELIKKPEVRFENDHILIPGSMKIDDFNEDYLFVVLRQAGIEKLGEIIEQSVLPYESEHETMGGFVFDLFGRFPVEGESVNYNALKFSISRIMKKRISEIRVEYAQLEEKNVA